MDSEEGKLVSGTDLYDMIEERAKGSKQIRDLAIVAAVVVLFAGLVLTYTMGVTFSNFITIACGVFIATRARIMHKQYKSYMNTLKALPK